jgi:hypothetical protein
MLLTGKSVRARARGMRLASVFVLAVQVLSFGHLLLVHHVTCPEHGEVIHTSHSAAALPGRANWDTAGAVQHSIAATEPSEGDDHDHCLACVESNRRTVLSEPAQALAHHTFVISVAGATTRTAFFAPIDLILLSPKSSPPSV